MKIGIVTVYNSSNYGSKLQAFALQRVLENLGHKVSFIPWTGRNILFNSIMWPSIITRHFSYKQLNAARCRYKVLKNDQKFFKTQKKLNDIDLVIIGSDTLWDVKRKCFQKPVFYGKIKTDKPIITYAVSCSDSDEGDFYAHQKLIDHIANIHSIFVRDTHTQKVVERVCGRETGLVCDPTLLVDEKIWNIQNVEVDLSDVILIYTYSLPQNIIGHIKRYAEENHLRTVALCMYQAWCDEYMCCSTYEFPSYLKAARYVVTNTFHGTIFSIISESNSVIIENGNKLQCLVTDLEAESLLLKQDVVFELFACVMEKKKDYGNIKKVISRLKKASLEILKEAIDSVKDN